MTLRIVALASALLVPSAALAAPTIVELAQGFGGPEDERGGAGNEQPSVAVVEKDGKRFVVSIYMSSDVSSGDRPWQCKCSSVELDPLLGPTLVADRVQLTSFDGNRPCNHPKAASDGESVIWTFGSNNPNLAQVRTYVAAVDELCRETGAPFRVSENGNNNEGAPDIAWNGGSRFTGGYLSTGENDRTYALGLEVAKDPAGNVTFTKSYLTNVVSPANIGRPTILPMGMDRSLVCAAKGDQRPPEDGIQCGLVDNATGLVLWRELVAPSDPPAEIYMNQPQLVQLSPERVALMAIESRGQGRKSGNKAPSITHLYTLAPDDLGAHMESEVDSVGPYQAHATICAGRWGQEATPIVGLFDASITGGGLAVLTAAKWDAAAMKLAAFDDHVAGAHNGDSGYIANIYGQNPGNQGRDFLRCLGDVANPGYGLAEGFRPDVKSFFALPYTGRKPGQPKNALFLSLMPGELAPAPAATPTPTPGETGSDPGDPPAADGGGKTSSGACSIAGVQSALPIGVALLYAFVLAEAARRRVQARRDENRIGGVS